MKIRLSTFIFLCVSFVTAQSVQFPSVWKFRTGDSIHYKEVSYNDSTWRTISVPSLWETQGISQYDGFAWYRVRFSVPKNLLHQQLYLLPGKIDDADETFINGTLVSATGKFPPAYQSSWDVQRAYKIPAGVLKENNLLAVRVYDGNLGGGIYGGSIGIFTKKEYQTELHIGPAPKKSYYKLTTSNGLIAAVYDEKKNEVESVLPHIFQAYDSAQFVRPFAHSIRLKSDAKPISVKHADNTHVIEAKYSDFSIYYYTPFTTNEKILYAVARGRKNIIEHLSFTSESETGELLTEQVERTEKQLGEKYFLFSFNDSLHDNSHVADNAAKRIVSAHSSLVDSEINYMKNVFASSKIPKVVSQQERDVVEQSISVLKMSQVSETEIFPNSRGQVLASLPPGVWNIAWVRDGCYAIMAMARIGMHDEAKRALRFMLAAPSNQYRNFIHSDEKEYGIGTDYQISVCRYFGNGREESDFNDQGPNIEIDGFGLFLSALAEYVRCSGDTTFVHEWNDVITTKIADAILHCIEPNDLIRKESGPWERHLPGKQYAFTSAACADGLAKIAALYSAMNLPSQPYAAGAARLKKGILAHFVYNHEFIKGNEQGISPTEHEFMDGQVFEGFANGVLTDASLFKTHMKAYDNELRVADPKRGYLRINSADWYESQEWLFIDARIATAQMKFGNRKEAKRLLDWITSQSNLNFNLIPEMYGKEHATYEGAIPMVGFGAGAYILALMDYYSIDR